MFSAELDPELRRRQQSLTKLPKLSRRRRKDSDEDYDEGEEYVSTSKKSRSSSGGVTTATGGGQIIRTKALVVEECDSDENSPHEYNVSLCFYA